MMKLLPLDEAMLEKLLRDLDTGVRELCSNGTEAKGFLVPVLQHTLDFHRRVNSSPPWQSYLGIESPTNQLVGVCAFKSNPNAAGEVEIAYCTVPGLEGRGHATDMAKGLVEIAFESPAIRRVIAHTLPETNASGRVLQKAGLTNVGKVIDPEDGKVWRWEINCRKGG
jgi:RimJ/RimL family protein N-acetyltransferase